MERTSKQRRARDGCNIDNCHNRCCNGFFIQQDNGIHLQFVILKGDLINE